MEFIVGALARFKVYSLIVLEALVSVATDVPTGCYRACKTASSCGVVKIKVPTLNNRCRIIMGTQ